MAFDALKRILGIGTEHADCNKEVALKPARVASKRPPFTSEDLSERKGLLKEAIEFTTQRGHIECRDLQRELNVGFHLAMRLMENMEHFGIVKQLDLIKTGKTGYDVVRHCISDSNIEYILERCDMEYGKDKWNQKDEPWIDPEKEKMKEEEREKIRLQKLRQQARKEVYEEEGLIPQKRHKIPKEVREYVMYRDNYQCVKCGETNRKFLEIDHIIPWSLSHDDSPDNLQVLCSHCNRCKSDNIE